MREASSVQDFANNLGCSKFVEESHPEEDTRYNSLVADENRVWGQLWFVRAEAHGLPNISKLTWSFLINTVKVLRFEGNKNGNCDYLRKYLFDYSRTINTKIFRGYEGSTLETWIFSFKYNYYVIYVFLFVFLIKNNTNITSILLFFTYIQSS